MIKFLHAFSFLIFLFIGKTYSQAVSIGTIDPGPYGSGSTIAVPVHLDESQDYFKTDNKFTLYLSDASGNFNNEQEIGTFTGFYATFINGIIPSGLPAGNYRVRVKSSSPAVISAASPAFEIRAENGVEASLDAPAQQVITTNNIKEFGYCTPGKSNSRFNFTNTSTEGANVTAVFTNEANTSDTKTLSFETSPQQFIPEISHYTIFVRAEKNGIVGTQAYFLINNLINTPFNPPGSSTVCLPLGELEYNVETNSSNGIQLNFPGNTYQITWGDGSVETYNLSGIKANGGKVRHLYTRSSCGSQITIGSIRYYNVFGIVVQSKSPFCGNIGVPVSSQAKVVTQPENRFTVPLTACLNTSLTIFNESVAGEDPGTSSPSCQNNNVTYYWYVDNKPVTPQGVPITYQLKYTFTTPGLHSIRLESESTSECQANPVEKTIYVQPPPQPDFLLQSDTYCVGSVVKPVDKSVLDTDPAAQYSYEWVISGPAAPVFTNGTDNTSKEPEISFTKAGVYTIGLNISSVCSTVSATPQTITINEAPAITATWAANLCGKDQLLTFNDTGGNPVRTAFSGTFKEESDTYSWTISGGNYSFENNTTASSKEPSVLFKDYGIYTISITHKNNCGSVTESHTITFNESPTINAGDDRTICAGSTATLNGTITGPPVASFIWKGGDGTFSPGRNVLNPEYTPTAAEIQKGEVDLVLSAVTQNPAPCDKVEDIVIITINPPNKLTSPAQKTICTGTAVNYHPEAVVAGSTFRWSATGTTNASGFQASGTGDITDVITNTDPNQNAVVTYTIVPESNGCSGDAFLLNVTVSPLPVLTVTADNSTICTAQAAGIHINSNLTGTKLTWTSTVTGNITGNSKQATPTQASAINDILVNNGNTPGTVTYTFTPVTAAGCQGQAARVTIAVSAPPVKANAGADQKLCNQNSVKLDGNNPGQATGKWTLLSGQQGVTFDDATKFDAEATGLKAGENYRFQWTISGPYTCQPSSDEVVISVLPEITSNTITTAADVLCQGSDIFLTGSTPGGGDGTYTYSWETSVDGTDWAIINGAQEKDLKITAVSTAFFRRKVSSGTCSNYSNILKIEVQKSISNNTISGAQYICSNTVPSLLTGSQPEGADGIYSYSWELSTDDGKTWSPISSGVAANYQSPALTQSTSFRRIVASAVCNGLQRSVSNIITVRVSPGPLARFSWVSDASCAPFVISAQTIKAEASEEGDTYTWFADGKQIGTGIDFPGYTLQNPGDSVTIKLQVGSKLGCGASSYSHTFSNSQSLTANFAMDKTKGCGPLTVTFSNTTENTQGVSFKWNFGNGITSASATPGEITFQGRDDGSDTTYTVTLTATSKCVVSEKTLNVTVAGKAVSAFAPDRTTGCSPLTVNFRNDTKGAFNTYTWDFGDGSDPYTITSRENVQHTFTSAQPKLYTVKLLVENECGKDESTYVIKISPNTVYPDLVVNGNEIEGCAPHTVNFINNTTGASVYTYDFGDGSAAYTTNSSAKVPHTYLKGGTYTVKLTASNGCSDTTTTETIVVYPQAETNFTASEVSGCGSLNVAFTNKTTGGTSYLWDFGDGTTSTEENPIHTYMASKDPYTVTLTSTSPFGCTATEKKEAMINVIPPPKAAFDVLPGNEIKIPDYHFTFRDASEGDVKSWSWDFGINGASSTGQNPEYTYPDTGTYKVTLTVTSAQGCSDKITQNVRISGIPGGLFIPNAFMPNSATEELRRFQVKGSGIESWHLRIFDKWGELIWQTTALNDRGVPSDSWDGTRNGTPVPQGVYFWEVSAKFKNGTEWAGMSYNSADPKRTGVIHLIR